MSQHYTDTNREDDPYALPDVETFYKSASDFANADADTWMAERLTEMEYSPTACAELAGWYYWYCLPGCLPDSDPIGPFNTEDEALEDARANA